MVTENIISARCQTCFFWRLRQSSRAASGHRAQGTSRSSWPTSCPPFRSAQTHTCSRLSRTRKTIICFHRANPSCCVGCHSECLNLLLLEPSSAPATRSACSKSRGVNINHNVSVLIVNPRNIASGPMIWPQVWCFCTRIAVDRKAARSSGGCGQTEVRHSCRAAADPATYSRALRVHPKRVWRRISRCASIQHVCDRLIIEKSCSRLSTHIYIYI